MAYDTTSREGAETIDHDSIDGGPRRTMPTPRETMKAVKSSQCNSPRDTHTSRAASETGKPSRYTISTRCHPRKSTRGNTPILAGAGSDLEGAGGDPVGESDPSTQPHAPASKDHTGVRHRPASSSTSIVRTTHHLQEHFVIESVEVQVREHRWTRTRPRRPRLVTRRNHHEPVEAELVLVLLRYLRVATGDLSPTGAMPCGAPDTR